MGTPTPHLSLLKPDPEELVTVTAHLNQNLDKLDADALDKEARLNILEVVNAVTAGWVGYGSVVRAGVGNTIIPHSPNRQSYFRLGNLVFIDYDLTLSPAAPADFLHGPQLKLPFELNDEHSANCSGTITRSGNICKLHFQGGADVDYLYSRYMQDDTSSGSNLPLIVEDGSAPAKTITLADNFRVFGFYRTNGVSTA